MILQWWNESRAAGMIKKKIRRMLQGYYGFGTWHTDPVNNRPYGLEVVRTLNKLIDENKFKRRLPFVEVGCGLGDIIGSLKWKHGKHGYDVSAEILKGGIILHPGTKFHQGTFDAIEVGEINCLIMVGFVHMIPYEKLKEEINTVLRKNRVKMFVLDTFTEHENTEYTYSHNGEYVFGGKYKLARKSEGFPCAHGAKRFIEYWVAVKK